MRDFNDLFSGMSHRDEFVFFGNDWLILGFNFIVDICLGHKFLLLYNFVLEDLDFFDLGNKFLNSNYFLFYCWDFLNLLFKAGGMNDFIDKFVNNFILSDNYWLFCSDFDEFRHFHHFLNNLFHLVDFGNFVLNCDNLVLVNWDFNYSFFDSCNRNSFFLVDLDFFYLLAYLCDFLFHFFYLLMDYNLLFNTRYFFNSGHLFDYLYDFFYLFRHLFNLLNLFFDHDQLLDYLLTRYRHFEGNNHSLLNLNNLLNFNPIGNNPVDANFFRNFNMSLNNFIFLELDFFDLLFSLCYWNNLFFDNFDSLNLCYWDVFDTFNFNYFLNDYGYLHLLDDLDYFLNLHDPIYNFFNDLRYLYYLLDYSRHNDNLLHYFLDFDDFRNFYHFFNDFVNMYSNLFNLFNNFGNLDYFFD